jgi:hypothetical protein
MRLDSNIAKLTLEYWLLPLTCCPTKVQNSTWKIDPSHQGAKFCVENRPISTHLTRVQNSKWKIDPYRLISPGCKILRGKSTHIDPSHQGAKFYVENRPISAGCKILRGKSTRVICLFVFSMRVMDHGVCSYLH